MPKSDPKIVESATDSSVILSSATSNPDDSSLKSSTSIKKKRYDKTATASASAAPGTIDSDDEYDGKCYVLDDREPGDVPESDFMKFMQRSRKSTADKNIVLEMEEDEGDLPIEDDALASTAASVIAAATADTSYYYEGEGGAGEAGAGETWGDDDPVRSYPFATSSEAAGEGDITKFRRVSASSSEAGAATSLSSITSSRSSHLGSTSFSAFGSSTSYWSAFPSSEKYALFGLSHTTSPGTTTLFATAPPAVTTGTGASASTAATATSSTVTSTLPEKHRSTVSKPKTASTAPVKVLVDKKAASGLPSDKKPTHDKKVSEKKSAKSHTYEIPKFNSGKKAVKSTASGTMKTSQAEMLVERMSSKRV